MRPFACFVGSEVQRLQLRVQQENHSPGARHKLQGPVTTNERSRNTDALVSWPCIFCCRATPHILRTFRPVVCALACASKAGSQLWGRAVSAMRKQATHLKFFSPRILLCTKHPSQMCNSLPKPGRITHVIYGERRLSSTPRTLAR